jgi:hypothetical protein
MSCVRTSYLFPFHIKWIFNDNKQELMIPLSVLMAVEDANSIETRQELVTRKFVLPLSGRELLQHDISETQKTMSNEYTYQEVESVSKTRNEKYNPSLGILAEPLSWVLFIITKTNKFVAWSAGSPHSVSYRESNGAPVQHIKFDQYVDYVLVDVNYQGRGLCVKLINIIFDKFKSMKADIVGIYNLAGKIGEKCYLHGRKHYDFECLKLVEGPCELMKFKLKSN